MSKTAKLMTISQAAESITNSLRKNHNFPKSIDLHVGKDKCLGNERQDRKNCSGLYGFFSGDERCRNITSRYIQCSNNLITNYYMSQAAEKIATGSLILANKVVDDSSTDACYDDNGKELACISELELYAAGTIAGHIGHDVSKKTYIGNSKKKTDPEIASIIDNVIHTMFHAVEALLVSTKM